MDRAQKAGQRSVKAARRQAMNRLQIARPDYLIGRDIPAPHTDSRALERAAGRPKIRKELFAEFVHGPILRCKRRGVLRFCSIHFLLFYTRKRAAPMP